MLRDFGREISRGDKAVSTLPVAFISFVAVTLTLLIVTVKSSLQHVIAITFKRTYVMTVIINIKLF